MDTTTTNARAPHEAPWVGPQAFEAMAGQPGTDRDFGMRWGERREQRITLRCIPGESRGLLYAYDPLWDEYAVLATQVPAAAVEAAFTQALDINTHMHVLEFAELVRCHQILGHDATHGRIRAFGPDLGLER